MSFPRVRVSVRALMILVLLLGGGFGWVVRHARIQRQAVAAIRQAGGHVLYDWETRVVPGPIYDDLRDNPAGRPWWPKWVIDRLGPDYFGDVKVVTLHKTRDLDGAMAHVRMLTRLEALLIGSGGTLSEAGTAHLRGLSRLRILYFNHDVKIAGAALKHIRGLRHLQRLTLRDGSLSDADLTPLEGLTGLRTLEITCPSVTDAGLSHVKGLGELRELFLVQCQVTDAGLKQLAGLRSLSRLMALQTRITPSGISALREANPRLQVSYR